MPRRRVDVASIITAQRAYGITIPTLSVATGFAPRDLSRMLKDGTIVDRPKRDSPADKLETFAGTSDVLAGVLPARFVYQWWQRPNHILDFYRPIDIHIDNPRACRQAAVRFAETRQGATP